MNRKIDKIKAGIENEFPKSNITNKFIKENFDYLPLFSAEEFYNRLPAYIIYSLNNFDPDNEVCEFTIYGLSPGKDYSENEFWAMRYGLFNKVQLNLVLEFLVLISIDKRFKFIFSQVKRAPERIIKSNEQYNKSFQPTSKSSG